MHVLFLFCFFWIVIKEKKKKRAYQRRENIWHAVKWQHFDGAVPRTQWTESFPPRQGWCYKRYRRLSRPNSTVIISTTADSHTHTQYVILMLRLPVCFFLLVSTRPPLVTVDPPGPFKNRFHSDVQPPGASTHLTVTLSVLSSFSRGRGRGNKL